MSNKPQLYCLDANVIIEAWQKYYSPKFCPSYWEVLNNLGKQGRLFIPKNVSDEITRTEDDLAKWLKTSDIKIEQIDGNVTSCLSKIYAANPLHKFLVDNTRQRSLADPWVIAHAMNSNACVVTKENFETAANSKRIKIPNVCQNMGIRWINDFALIEELNLKFSCEVIG
ncbi:DUF4411 family protein [Mucilaginibacter sp. OK283]|jgi:hypothetical protein|uniref:DUF4411 family protein n=1 Tax=Mucilaginibacter sp. OK283 TaxID=1881049 RepID=UPI0008CC11EF|nr:DUF4411 family protein [Mucilaginibacter sp. OK283]SEO59355.1 protein of unknown function [Mucilaginibacter sp. OK283]